MSRRTPRVRRTLRFRRLAVPALLAAARLLQQARAQPRQGPIQVLLVGRHHVQGGGQPLTRALEALLAHDIALVRTDGDDAAPPSGR